MSDLLHSFLDVHNCVATFTSHGKLHEFGAEKPISRAKLAHFAFSPIKVNIDLTWNLASCLNLALVNY